MDSKQIEELISNAKTALEDGDLEGCVAFAVEAQNCALKTLALAVEVHKLLMFIRSKADQFSATGVERTMVQCIQLNLHEWNRYRSDVDRDYRFTNF